MLACFVYAPADQLRVMERWLERPYLPVFPALGGFAAFILARSVRRRWDGSPISSWTPSRRRE
jgi:cytochrome bd ubiquinol oxidase subunit II